MKLCKLLANLLLNQVGKEKLQMIRIGHRLNINKKVLFFIKSSKKQYLNLSIGSLWLWSRTGRRVDILRRSGDLRYRHKCRQLVGGRSWRASGTLPRQLRSVVSSVFLSVIKIDLSAHQIIAHIPIITAKFLLYSAQFKITTYLKKNTASWFALLINSCFAV